MTVLRDGVTVATRAVSEVDHDTLIKLMIGRGISSAVDSFREPAGDVLLEVRDLCCQAARLRDISLVVKSGEILGLAGLVGSGRTDLARALVGLESLDSGAVSLRGNEIMINSPAQAIRSGIALVPEDRRRHGVIAPMSILHNMTLASLNGFSRRGFIKGRAERRTATELTRELGVKTPSIFATTGNLSGGNQQKVALARWLAADPAVLILDEPTQGVDVGAKSEIHRLIKELAGRGKAIILISSDWPELMGLSDRIAVMREGSIAGVLDRTEATEEKLLRLAFGHSTDETN